MITVRGKVVSFSGKDEKQLRELAKKLGKTPQETVELAIREQIDRLDVTPSKADLKVWHKLIDECVNTKKSFRMVSKTTKRSK